MMAKDSVKKRFNGEFNCGMSFTEFTYQLLQGYDFVYLNEHKNCKLQMGGSDQWGNITTGTELIKKISGNEAFALTCPLVTKADGTKFGKTESGNIWLDRNYTSPYRFYQFWMNVADDDAKRYIRIFTTLGREEIESLIAEHDQAPHLRLLQKRLAEEVTVMVHSREDYEAAVEASQILFGNATAEALHRLDEETFLQVMDGVPQFTISRAELEQGIAPLDLLAEKTQIFPSKGEARKMIQANGFSMNKEKLTDPQTPITTAALLNNRYILFQKGKKNYYLVKAE
jgi:tyrosyl-tRNA synthetase